MMGILHGEQDFRFHRPIEPGMKLVTRAAPIGIHGRSSGRHDQRQGRDTRRVLRRAGRRAVHDPVRPRRSVRRRRRREPAPTHGFDESLRERSADAEVAQTFDADQTFRYSEASGDPVPVHLDDEVAKSVGLPGIIIHGLCTMAFTSVAVIEHACAEDPTRLKRLAVRFSKPCQPEQTITTRIWDAGEAADRVYAYETTSDSGDVVIKDGLAEVES